MFNKDWTYRIIDCPNNMVSIASPYNASTHQYTKMTTTDEKVEIDIDKIRYTFVPNPDMKGWWKFTGQSGVEE